MLPRIDGKFLHVDGRRFRVKGVAYGTFAPDAAGDHFPALSRMAGDFAAMSAAGVNTVRTYTVPPAAALDAAAHAGLRVMVGIPWPQHIAFLDDHHRARQIRRDAAATVRRLASHPAALAFAVGNEIPAAVVRWHGQRRIEQFLRDLYDEVKSAAPESLLTYVNFPPTEYLDLECFDLCAFNVYLHGEADLRAYLARLQHVAGSRPLLLAEAGGDSIREGQDGQARITAMHVRTAFEEGACGAVVFSWTDEWWRGGHTVEDWAFGLVDSERRPKPALAAVERAFAEAPFPAIEQARWPKVSVVVCAHNAADTIDDCLTSLTALTYPQVELILVNDGSTDATGSIARRYDGVRIIDVPNGGLSAARNIGLAHASGEIVAYTDADVRVDQDWLTYLVQPMLTSDVVGAGGPNIVPADDPWMAQCVARAPGGPTHVLLDDRIAEHIPGCNMAFRREALLAIGGFNPVYLRAGDDVDICWRLQDKGWRIGFASAALVWHHHRSSVEAFWRQQVGYGEGEAWLLAHHPERFVSGQMLWRGHIYSPLPFVRSLRGRRVNTGMWGTAAFPSVYQTGSHSLQFVPHSAAWLVVASALLLWGAIGLPARSAQWMVAAGLVGWATTLVRCAMFALRSDLTEQRPPSRGFGEAGAVGRLPRVLSLFVSRTMIAWLHLIQPLARMRGRIRGMWFMPPVVATDSGTKQPWKPSLPSLGDARASGRLLLGNVTERSFWSESWLAHTSFLSDLAGVLRASRPTQLVDLDDGWHADRDLSVAVGRWGWLNVRVLVEEHAQGRCLVRTGASLRPSPAGIALGVLLAIAVAAAASTSGRLGWPLGAVSLAVTAAIVARSIWQTTRVTAVLNRALTRVAGDAGLLPLPLQPAASDPGRGAFRPATAVRAFQTAMLALIVGGAVLGGLSIARDLAEVGAASTAANAVPASVINGGVAVGLAGDVFIADPQQGTIRRLRPRPPLDASWTAQDIGTDGFPLLGNTVPFDAAADIAVAPSGDLYIADARNNRISRIVRSTGEVVTIGGSGELRGPSGVAVAHNGDVYVADTLNNRVRVIAQATGLVTTIAGDLDRPAGVAVATNGDVYIADTGNNRIRMVAQATGVTTTVAEDLNRPTGVAVAPDGAVYIADTGNNRVRVIDADGVITTLEGAQSVLSPTRVAYHPAGWLYVKDASPDGLTAVAVRAVAGRSMP